MDYVFQVANGAVNVKVVKKGNEAVLRFVTIWCFFSKMQGDYCKITLMPQMVLSKKNSYHRGFQVFKFMIFAEDFLEMLYDFQLSYFAFLS